jgi:hypothetical protein
MPSGVRTHRVKQHGNILLSVMIESNRCATELNIHDQIERGDNDTIKVGNNDVKIHKACSS